MNKYLAILAAITLPLTALGSTLAVNNGGGATNITSTSAWITATIVSTGAANPYLYSYWGTNDGGSNAASWLNTTAFGESAQGAHSAQITGLSGDTVYYFRAYGSNSTSSVAWASYSSQFLTLTTPTSAPPSSTRMVSADTNGALVNPTNFFHTNSPQMADALSEYIGDTNAIWGNITGTLANQTDLQGELDAKAGTNNLNALSNKVDVIETNYFPLPSGLALSNTVATLTNDVAVLQTHTTNTVNPHEVTAAQIGAATGTPLYAFTEADTNALFQLGAHTTNQLNPHGVTPAQIGAVPITGETLTGPLTNEYGYYGDGSGLTNLTSDPSTWSDYPATQQVVWYGTEIVNDTNYLVISGSSSPEVAGLYHWDEIWFYRSALGYVAPQEDLETNIVFWYLVSGSSEFRNYSVDPTAGGYDAYNNATGTLLAAYGSATNAVTWRAGYDTNINAWAISRDGVQLQAWYPGSNVLSGPVVIGGVARETWPSEYSDTAIRADLSAVSNQAAAGSNLAYEVSVNLDAVSNLAVAASNLAYDVSVNLDAVSNWAVAGSNLAFDVAGNLSIVSNQAAAGSNLAYATAVNLDTVSNVAVAASNLAYDVSVNLDTVSNVAVAASNLAYALSGNLDAVSNWAVAGSNLAYDVSVNLDAVSNLAVAASNLAAAGGADLTTLSNNLSAVSNLAALALPTTGGTVTGNVELAGGNLTASTLTLTNGPAARSVWVMTNANGSGELRVLAKMVMRPYGAPAYSGVYATNKWGDVATSVGGLTGTVDGIKVHRAGYYHCNMLLSILGLTNQNQYMRAQLTRNNGRLHNQYGPISADPNQLTISCNQGVVYSFSAGDVIGVQYYLYNSSEGQTNKSDEGGFLSVHELP